MGSESSEHRKLAAIMFTDIVGYSGLKRNALKSRNLAEVPLGHCQGCWLYGGFNRVIR